MKKKNSEILLAVRSPYGINPNKGRERSDLPFASPSSELRIFGNEFLSLKIHDNSL